MTRKTFIIGVLLSIVIFGFVAVSILKGDCCTESEKKCCCAELDGYNLVSFGCVCTGTTVENFCSYKKIKITEPET
jgi:hypothetical protein